MGRQLTIHAFLYSKALSNVFFFFNFFFSIIKSWHLLHAVIEKLMHKILIVRNIIHSICVQTAKKEA